MLNNYSIRERFISNKIGLVIILLFAIAPFFGFATLKFIGREFDVIISILSLGCVIFLFLDNGYLKIPLYVKLWFLFTLFTVISDIFIAKTDVSPLNLFFYNKFVTCFYILLIVENISIPKDFYNLLSKTNLVVLYIAFFAIVIQQFISASFFVNPKYLALLRQEFSEIRFPSIYSWLGPSSYLGLSFFPLLAIVISEKLRENKDKLLLLFLLGLVVAFLNKSRFMMLNFLITLILLPIYQGFQFNKVLKFVAISIAIVFSVYFGAKAVNFNVDKIISERILEEDQGGMINGAAGTRIIAFEVFGKLFPKNPVLGRGYLHSFGKEKSKDIDLVQAIHGRSSQIHVGYLSLFYYYGIVGGGLYMLFLGTLFRKLYSDAKKTFFWGVLIAWIMFFLTNMTAVVLSFINMGLILSLFINKYYVSQLNREE